MRLYKAKIYKAKKYCIEYKLDIDILRLLSISFVLFVMLLLSACSKVPKDKEEVGETLEIKDERIESTISVDKVEGLSDEFMLGVDISSILSLEDSGGTSFGIIKNIFIC